MFFIKMGAASLFSTLMWDSPHLLYYLHEMNIYYSSIGSLARLGMLLNCSKGTG